MSHAIKNEISIKPLKPILKWAGGKTQLLDELFLKIPNKYGKYIEPFIGGGALFFSLHPENAIIADSNPELINLYNVIAHNVQDLIRKLKNYQNTEEFFYYTRSQKWEELPFIDAAARTLFLNKTCYNGLYRVNRNGQFNVPYGKYKNPKIFDEKEILLASELLKRTKIICSDYKTVLREYASPNDFIYLDPPYLPISEYADFKRYTKEQFYEEDHHELSKEIYRLHEIGCHIVLTNSNHPLVHEQYKFFNIEVIKTNRYISSNPKKRKGEDLIISIPPKPNFNLRLVADRLPDQVNKYPPTRFMGSKNKLLSEIWSIASQFQFDTAVDLFSGSGIVGYMFKSQGKKVFSNDYMAMSSLFAQAMIENNSITLSETEVSNLLKPNDLVDQFVQLTFKDLYFTDQENMLIDIIRCNSNLINNKYKRAIARSALIRACLKKRPRGIFTYVGHRYDDGRKDLQTSLHDHFLMAIEAINNSVFNNSQKNKSYLGDALDFKPVENSLIYIDPPYYSPYSDNEYVRRYHFLEGIALDWKGVEIQEHTSTKKFKSYPTPFSSRKGALDAFNMLFKRFKNSILLVSYSSNSLPTQDEIVGLMSNYKNHVEVVPIDYKYSFGNQAHKVGNNKNDVHEYLFVGY